MFSDKIKKEYYKALVSKDKSYEGIFYVGVKTTGVFCLSICSAKKPKFENCEFYETPQQALLASFRPCKRCQPLSHPSRVSNLIQILVKAVEKEPERRWKSKDLQALSIDVSTARRQFKKRFGMTFMEYSRARRMGIAMKHIKAGEPIIEAQLSAGYESSSGFRDAFSQIMGNVPTTFRGAASILKASWIDTPLGPMLAIADEKALHLLEFVSRRGLEREIERLRKRTKAAILPGTNVPLSSIEKELNLYFEGNLKKFQTPYVLEGSPFQRLTWEALGKIPYGEICSYAQLSSQIGKPSAYRAVANANGANQLAIIIPCHRVINTGGELGGYGGGIVRKKWLIEHERKNT